jgi:hypothetical protein
VANSSFGRYPDPAGPDAEPIVLAPDATAIRDAYAYVRACEAGHPGVTVRRPWSRGNHSPHFVIEAHGTTRTCATVTDVRAALERDFPSAAEAGTP